LFRCTEGHLSKPHEHPILVPTRRRIVRYANWATDDRGLTVLFLSQGVEIVEERPYCREHVPALPEPVPSEIERTHRFTSRRSRERLRREYGAE